MTQEERNSLLISTIAAVLSLPEEELHDDASPDSIPSWDSVAHLNIVVAVEEAFGTSFSPEETMEMTSVRLMKLLLEEKLAA
jgi:acyl carrier protein